MDKKETPLKGLGAGLRARLPTPGDVPPEMLALVVELMRKETEYLTVRQRVRK